MISSAFTALRYSESRAFDCLTPTAFTKPWQSPVVTTATGPCDSLVVAVNGLGPGAGSPGRGRSVSWLQRPASRVITSGNTSRPLTRPRRAPPNGPFPSEEPSFLLEGVEAGPASGVRLSPTPPDEPLLFQPMQSGIKGPLGGKVSGRERRFQTGGKLPPYSPRMVIMGSTRVPRRVGIQLATRPVTRSRPETPRKVRGSLGVTS